ncbi:hypothetical protein [Bradyrhizobium sp. WSM3983]|uniref:phage pre-tape measure protein n=1 Tax=Bradyrhizobium sp. WSM3983 TaxID=1038867 RepID=UPI000486D2BA|nr:hypothetical protein [Bradyrhizobium sp. WSM3983]
MALKYNHVTRTVDTPGGQIVLRGLNIQDIAGIVGRHSTDLNALFATIQSGAAGVSVENFDAVAAFLLQTVPGAAADIIAYAAFDPAKDDPAALVEDALTAFKIEAPVQLMLLEKIGELTFAMVGVKKALEIVVRMMQGTTSLVAEVQGQPR